MTAETIPTISAFSWVPDFARGRVRDLIARWALEELGQPYTVELLDARSPRGPDYVARHPFDQVPTYRDDEVDLFESGAILLHLGGHDARLLPTNPAQRALAISWLAAGLSTVEPALKQVATLPLFHGDKPWAAGAVEGLTPLAEKRLSRLSDALDGKDWLAGDFSIADITMVFVLQNFAERLIDAYPALVAYRDRGTARPAYKRALQAQLDDFTD